MTAPTTYTSVDYFLLTYVPNILSDKSVSIAAIVFSPDDPEPGVCAMFCAADWQNRVSVVDSDADLETVQALLSDIRNRLGAPLEHSVVLRDLESSFSNLIQVSPWRACTLDPGPNAIEDFARRLLDKASTCLSRLSSMREPIFEATP